MDLKSENEIRRRAWNRNAPRFDREMGFMEKLMGREHRPWACHRASGKTLEVAIGTGLNLPFYRDDVELIGIDLSVGMLEIARERAEALGRTVELLEGDAHELPFPAGTFDSVVCTYSLCGIPDPGAAVAEMKRVLQPDGRLILVDHIRSSVGPLLTLQRVVERFTRREGEYMTRRPLEQVLSAGFRVEDARRYKAGVIERVLARPG
jgi:ubiquinone/menaquinone biosynthesis C-methylase UbiE